MDNCKIILLLIYVMLDRSDIVRDLGVSFDAKLSFVHHSNATVNECSRALGFIIRNTKEFTKSKTLITLFLMFIRSKLDYSMIIWQCIERVQRCFLKYVWFRVKVVYPRIGFPQSELLAEFAVVNMVDRCKMLSANFMFKLIHFCPKNQ
jgi:hypothetical protein